MRTFKIMRDNCSENNLQLSCLNDLDLIMIFIVFNNTDSIMFNNLSSIVYEIHYVCQSTGHNISMIFIKSK